jgi:F-type H+-transporting ATPase subunit a
VKSFVVAAFSLFSIMFSNVLLAQEKPAESNATEQSEPAKEKGKLNPGNLLLEHILDSHEFHFITVGKTEVSIPLPIILYSSGKGFSFFMSSRFEHGKETYMGYRMIDEEYLDKLKQEGVDVQKKMLSVGKIIGVDAAGNWDASISVLDLSMTRNVVQMLLGLILLVWLLVGVAKKYKRNGAMVAPSGFQNAVEPVITFVRDEVCKPNLGKKYEKYMPYMLTVFFFILIGNLIGLIPGTANVTGNIAFTAVLGLISFVVIIFSSNKHFWLHIFNPPGVPLGVKFILVPVEILGIFTKPFALIIRLFANMVAGHMIITCLILLIFIFGALNQTVGYSFSPVSIAFCVFIYFIEILVAFLQAFIFANLTAVFIGQAFEGEHHDEQVHI